MKKRSLILIIFVMLYITPVIFSISPIHTGIVTEQNTEKDFALSEYGDISNQSVLSISETLPKDIMFSSDALSSNIYLGASGDTDFEKTFVKDGVYLTLIGGGNADINFVFNETAAQIEGFDYAIFGYEATDDATTKYYQYPGWVGLNAFTVTPSFHNGTVGLSGLHGVANNYTLTLKFDAGVTADLYIDYVQVQFRYMTLADSDHYAESFADGDDWSNGYLACEGGDTWVSDGDVMTVDLTGDTGNDKDFIYYDLPDPMALDGDFSGLYLEVSHKENILTGYDYYKIWLADSTWGANTFNYIQVDLGKSTSWQTQKFYLGTESTYGTPSNITSVAIGIRHDTPSHHILEFDYLKIGPSNESGWQYNGSSISGVSSPTGDTVSSNGDLLILQSGLGDDNSFDIEVDNTTTPSSIDLGYYQFLEIRTTAVSEGDGWNLALFDGSDWIEITDGPYFGWMAYEYGLGTFRYNIETLANEAYTFRINTTATAEIHIEYIMVNSIVNFTLSSGSSNTVDDVLFCEDGELYSLITEGSNRYWILDYDIPISVPFAYNNYSLAVTTNTQWFAEYISGEGWQSWRVDEPIGILTKGTVTDFKILIDGTTALSSILFIETLSWQSLDGVTFYFVIGSIYGDWTIQAFMVFLGLVMIPVSTIYLVHGGREEISMDKVFYFFIMFIIGWALVIGGIVS